MRVGQAGHKATAVEGGEPLLQVVVAAAEMTESVVASVPGRVRRDAISR
jgi:hydroxyethylthiazole kinase-like sugar kinase family protein